VELCSEKCVAFFEAPSERVCFLCCESVNHLVDVKLILIHLQVVLTWLQQPTSVLLNIACSNVKL